MPREFTIISGSGSEGRAHRVLSPEERMKHVQKVTGVVLDSALDTWMEIWKEMQGNVTDACLVLPEAESGFKPTCGWPEFLEKVWLLKHYLDHARKLCQEKV